MHLRIPLHLLHHIQSQVFLETKIIFQRNQILILALIIATAVEAVVAINYLKEIVECEVRLKIYLSMDSVNIIC